MSCPDEFVVTIELAASVVAPSICVARVEVETVCTNPLVPVYVNPCVSDGKYSDDPNVDDAVENRPFSNPRVVEVEL